MGVIPVVNENDSVSPAEIESGQHKIFGDNDTLSAVVASLCGASLLVLLSDIDGLSDHDPRSCPEAKLLHRVEELTKVEHFLTLDRHFEKWAVVGHWPVVLYGTDRVCANPIIDRDKRIASIDGGCVLKDDGQLNCLILPHRDSEDFGFVSFDPFPVGTVLDEQEGGSRSYYIRWGDSTVEVLERGEEFSRCRHRRTGYEMEILTKYLITDNPVTDCNDCTDYVLPLRPGDRVRVVEETSRGYFVKHKGVSGWYYGGLL